MRRLLLPLATLLALALPPVAGAKGEVTALTVCGPERCMTSDQRLYEQTAATSDSARSLAPPAPGAYYRVSRVFDGSHRGPSAFYVPDANLVATRTEDAWTSWSRPSPQLAQVIRALTAKLTPFSTPLPTGVWVGAQQVERDPASYLRLFRIGATPGVRPDGERRSVWFTADRANPWTSTRIRYYPGRDVLEIAPGRFVRVPRELASSVEAARPLATRNDGGGGVPWRLPASIAVGALLLAVLAVWLLRRFRHVALPRPAGRSAG